MHLTYAAVAAGAPELFSPRLHSLLVAYRRQSSSLHLPHLKSNMRVITFFFSLLLLEVVTCYSIIPNDSGKNRSSLTSAMADRKTGRLLSSKSTTNYIPPGAKHNQNREEIPGRHRQGAWFLKEKSKRNNKKKGGNGNNNETPGRGRQLTYSKVSRW